MGDRVTVLPTAVLRGDLGKIVIGNGSNIQDGVGACVLRYRASAARR
jgi:carbonic anhydrase/acetyltransferase-like protein (isoleucine patch superfamily)